MEDRLARGFSLVKVDEALQLMLVTPAMLPSVWPQLEPIFLEHENVPGGWGEYYTIESILTAVTNEDMQLWAVNNDKEFFYVILTALIEYPKKKVVTTVWGGGKDLKEAVKVWDWMEVWANKQGATLSIGGGRKGILRRLRNLGYTQTGVAFEKDISGIREH